MPQLTAESRAGIDPVLEAVAAYGLGGSRLAFPDAPLTDGSWSDFLDAVARERLAGLLSEALLDGAFVATEQQVEAAATLHTDVAAVALLLERLLLEVGERLARRAVDFRVLKGPSIAHLDYADPSLRYFGDLDLLVKGSDFASAVEVLEAEGGHRAVPELRRGFDHRFGKGATIAMPGNLEVDLHRTFVAGPLGMTIDHDGVFAAATPFRIGTHELPALGAEERFVHACVHAALGRPVRLNSLRDIAEMALNGELDVDRVQALARAWRVRAVVARAVNLAWSTLDLADAVAVSAWAERYRPAIDEMRMLDAYLGGDRSFTRQAMATLRVIPRRRDKVAYARSLLFPQRRFLASRRDNRFDHIRRGSAHLRWGAAR